jgi:hypothetical protein
LSGATAAGINAFGQDYASNEYQNVYNRSLQQYQQRYNEFQQNQANQFNRLSALTAVGQSTAGLLGQLGQNYSALNTNTLMGGAEQIGRYLTDQGAARASGYVGQAGALTGMFNGLSSVG